MVLRIVRVKRGGTTGMCLPIVEANVRSWRRNGPMAA